MCVVGFTGSNESIVKSAANNALALIRNYTTGEFAGEKIITLGPMPARVAKISGKFRYRLIIKCRNSKRFRQMISAMLVEMGKDNRFSSVTTYADINPESTV